MSGQEIYQGLLDRGMPEHVALAFMDSFQSESGLNPTINEISPMIEGSRGGRGLYQLTGPRRVDFESKYGTDYATSDQLDHLIYELQGPEAKAAQAIFATDNREDAVRAITSKFLRPAVDNSDHRIGAWTGQAGINERASKGNVDKQTYEYERPKVGGQLHASIHDKLGGDERAGKRMAGIGNSLFTMGQGLLEDA